MNEIYVLIPIVISLGLFAMIAAIVISSTSAKKQRVKMMADVQNRMIDKFGSAPEFITFLSSPAGREFMAGFESQPRLAARDRILRGVRSATVLTALGLAFFLLAALGIERDMYVPGVLLMGLGGGYIVSTLLMTRLSKSWGLIEESREAPVVTAQNHD
jgi:hypothetical protein